MNRDTVFEQSLHQEYAYMTETRKSPGPLGVEIRIVKVDGSFQGPWVEGSYWDALRAYISKRRKGVSS